MAGVYHKHQIQIWQQIYIGSSTIYGKSLAPAKREGEDLDKKVHDYMRSWNVFHHVISPICEYLYNKSTHWPRKITAVQEKGHVVQQLMLNSYCGWFIFNQDALHCPLVWSQLV